MYIPRDLIMMGLGALILFVLVGGHEILFHYAELKEYEKEQEEKKKKVKKQHWIIRGWKNMMRDIKLKHQTKKEEIKPRKKMTRKETQAKLRKMFKD